MTFIESEVFWFPEKLQVYSQVDDPLQCLDQSIRQPLEAAYSQFCLSVKFQEDLCALHNDDLDEAILLEGKSLASWKGAPKRHAHGKSLRTDDTYKALVRRTETSSNASYTRKSNKFEETLLALVRSHLENKISLQALRNASSQEFVKMYKEAWNEGRKASGILSLQKAPLAPTREEENWFRSAVREELKFWDAFLDEIEKNKSDFSSKKYTMEERVAMYADTVKFMYNAGRVSGLPDTVLLSWYPTTKSSGRMCPGCQYMVDHSPFTRDTMPTVPRAGDTPCLYHCVHRVIVNYVTPAAVAKRHRELPTKDRMIRELHDLMKRRVHGSKGRAKHLNPWLRKSIYGELK